MTIAISACGCGCHPCVCTPPGQVGNGACLPAACLPRPTFFDGQVIGSADLNAVVDYARNQQAILARLLGGWGILGGLKVDAAPGQAAAALGTGNIAKLSRNPQIVAGTVVQVGAGVAIDASGNRLVSCAPVTLDIATMAAQAVQAQIVTSTCAQLLGPECRNPTAQLTATEFFLVAELAEVPTRPVGRVSGPGACDPITGCQFSRTVEDVRFSLVSALPDTYQFTGCIDPTGFQLPGVTLGTAGDPMLCRDEVFAFIDNVQGQLATICCSRPAVVLAKVLLTRAPGSLATGLPAVPQYLMITDAYPCRKPTFQVGWFTKEWPNVICNQVTSSPQIAPAAVVQTAGDHTRSLVSITGTTSDFFFINREGTTTLQAQLPRPRLASSSLRLTFNASYVVQATTFARFRLLVDGLALSTNGITLLASDVDPNVVRNVEISDVLPPSVIGEARAHRVQAQVSLTAAAPPANQPPNTTPPATTITFDPASAASPGGASIVVQEIAGGAA